MIRKGRESAYVLTEKDFRAILSTIDQHSPENPWKDSSIRDRNLIILMLLFCGLRSGEILQMQIYDIDLSKGFLYIRPKGSEMEKKKLLLPQNVLPLFRRYLLHGGCPGAKVRAKDHDYVFRSDRSGKRLMLQDLSRIFDVLQEKVPGLSTKVTANAFRHAYMKLAFDRCITKHGTPSSRAINDYCARLHSIYGATQVNIFDLKKKLKLTKPKIEK